MSDTILENCQILQLLCPIELRTCDLKVVGHICDFQTSTSGIQIQLCVNEHYQWFTPLSKTGYKRPLIQFFQLHTPLSPFAALKITYKLKDKLFPLYPLVDTCKIFGIDIMQGTSKITLSNVPSNADDKTLDSEEEEMNKSSMEVSDDSHADALKSHQTDVVANESSTSIQFVDNITIADAIGVDAAIENVKVAAESERKRFLHNAPQRIRELNKKIDMVKTQLSQDKPDCSVDIENILFAGTKHICNTPTWTPATAYEFFTLSSYISRCTQLRLKLRSVDRYYCRPIQEQYVHTCDTLVEEKISTVSLPNAFSSGPFNQYMLWRGYFPTEEQRLGFSWIHSKLPLDNSKGIVLSTDITEGANEWQLQHDKNAMLLCRCCLANATRSKNNFLIENNHLVIPAYRMFFDRV